MSLFLINYNIDYYYNNFCSLLNSTVIYLNNKYIYLLKNTKQF